MFEALVQSGSASGMELFNEADTLDPVLVQELMGVVTIVDDLPQPGVSVLVLDAVSEIDVGYYYCVAHYRLANGNYSVLESELAFLALNGELCCVVC